MPSLKNAVTACLVGLGLVVATAAQAQNSASPLTASAYFAAKDHPQTVSFPGGGDAVQDQAVLDKMLAFLDATFPQKQ